MPRYRDRARAKVAARLCAGGICGTPVPYMQVLSPRQVVLILGGLLVAVGVAAYCNSFTAPFVLDDTVSIVDNASIRQVWPPGPVLSPPAQAGVGGRPIANLSFAFNYAAGGLNVRGYHIVNLAIHLAAGLGLFGVARRTWLLAATADSGRTSEATIAAFGIALLWLVHPLQTEAVTYLSQRTEELMALFYVATLYGFLRGVTEDSRGWQVAAVACCALGMATKEVMVTAPIVVLLYDRTFLAGSFRAAWKQRKTVHLALAATWLLLALLLAEVGRRGVGYETVTVGQYALTECRAIATYLRLALLPTPLVFDYGMGVVHGAGEVWPQVALLIALLGTTGWLLWRRPKIGFLAAWIFLLLAPTSIVPVAGQPMAEHRMYLPLAAVCSAAVLALSRWLPRRALVSALAVLATALAGATVDRNRDYRSAIALWTDTVQKNPTNARAHAALGAAWLQQGNGPRAIASLERALQLDPRTADAHNNLANALLEQNRSAEAIGHFEAALRLRPDTASTHYNFGNALLTVGRTEEAIAQQREALRLRPNLPEAHCALGNALAATGRRPDAIKAFRDALRLQPNLVAAHFGLANALAQAGQVAESIPHYEATLRVTPDSVEAHYNLATACAMSGRIDDAIRHYEAALKLRPDLEAARANLAALRQGKR